MKKNSKELDEDEEEPMFGKGCIIMNDNKKKRWWNSWIAILLILTGMYVPLRAAFYDDVTTTVLILETVVDSCFIIDIFLTFFTAYEKNGHTEIRLKKIAFTYLKLWFWIDLFSSIPF